MKKINIRILSLFLLVAIAATAFAQEEEAPKKEEAPKEEVAKKKDNSGTNPINFTYDFRIIQ